MPERDIKNLLAHDFFHRRDDIGGLVHDFFCERFEIVAVNQLDVETLLLRIGVELGAGQRLGISCAQNLNLLRGNPRRREQWRAADSPDATTTVTNRRFVSEVLY